MWVSKCSVKPKISEVLTSLTCRLSSSTVIFNGAKDREGPSIDVDEVHKHSKLSKTWWNEQGEMVGLHSMNKLRVPFVRDGLINTGRTNPKLIDSAQPLDGMKILEVGCGGGIFTEPLARIGAEVTGVDASHDLIETARLHLKNDHSIINQVNYVHDTVENHVDDKKEYYDAVVASEVLEHITQKDLFMSSCISSLKPGGSIFITTLNRTLPAWACGIIAAEYLLRLVPQGTHEWNKFISPHETKGLLEKHNCSTVLVHGMFYNFLVNEWYWTANKSINYAIQAVKKEGS